MTGVIAALVDAHCHFDLFRNPREILEEAERGHIYSIAVTNIPSVFEPMKRLASGLKYVNPALGLHPELALQRSAELPLFAQLISSTDYVGEVGLDYKVAVRPTERSEQRSIFERILRHCNEASGRILTVHSRRAEADVVSAIVEHRPGPFILHWYSGTLKTLHTAVANGAYFSINIAMTRSERGRRIIQEIPRERVLTESDGPFVKLKNRPASPQSVDAVVEKLAAFWGAEPFETAAQVLTNFRKLLKGIS